ncbi:hypothetical protein HAZT_HAZT011182, partial [Hyalella azteca]
MPGCGNQATPLPSTWLLCKEEAHLADARFEEEFSTARFYQKNQTHTCVVPLDPSISDDDSLDDDISDPNYVPVPDQHNEDSSDTTEGQPPTSKRRCRRPVLEEVHEEEDDEEDVGHATPQEERNTTNIDDGILALRWKDNKAVTMLSNDLGVYPVTTCSRYYKETKHKEQLQCPNVIKSYNANMAGIDKSDMLLHLYRTPL